MSHNGAKYVLKSHLEVFFSFEVTQLGHGSFEVATSPNCFHSALIKIRVIRLGSRRPQRCATAGPQGLALPGFYRIESGSGSGSIPLLKLFIFNFPKSVIVLFATKRPNIFTVAF